MITLNGVSVEFAGSVADLVTQQHVDPRGLAVAVDGTVVPRADWARSWLAGGQQVEIVTAVQGG
ncbi:sulfur carrier protein ThiS [Nocardioides daejeonensis]|uniref:sulfur carrier protein ThiS n=1 Tax=Nocardioides daejeonensis TaxID=1046556 RepID=UPI000D744ABE|nr:sulfur carrier protein ThiS [Nocardioides daejeonensis]